ncbi:MAG: hypothetical protein HC804_02355 [Anaerolineae bacterium]|nr:hypothetical protein [Anaerolineae bacterium]
MRSTTKEADENLAHSEWISPQPDWIASYDPAEWPRRAQNRRPPFTNFARKTAPQETRCNAHS